MAYDQALESSDGEHSREGSEGEGSGEQSWEESSQIEHSSEGEPMCVCDTACASVCVCDYSV